MRVKVIIIIIMIMIMIMINKSINQYNLGISYQILLGDWFYFLFLLNFFKNLTNLKHLSWTSGINIPRFTSWKFVHDWCKIFYHTFIVTFVIKVSSTWSVLIIFMRIVVCHMTVIRWLVSAVLSKSSACKIRHLLNIIRM